MGRNFRFAQKISNLPRIFRGCLRRFQATNDGFIWKKLFVYSLLLRAKEDYSIVASLGLQWYASSGNLSTGEYTQLVGR